MHMPYRIEAARRLATVMMPERVLGRDIAETMRALLYDEAWAAGYRILWDGGIITELLFEKDDLPTFLGIVIEHAAVAPSCEVILVHHEFDYRMAGSYAGMVKSMHPVYVCRSLMEATSILDRG
jgi:hypothetical protein